MPVNPTTLRHLHGVLRGSEDRRRSRTFEGRFGRLFRDLPAAQFTEAVLTALAARMIEPRKPVSENPDPEENSEIPAGYTYLGQFIDHDLTFDPASSLQRADDPEALIDFRTPRFDLDSVYGRGPADQPYLYQDDGIRMLLGRMLGDLNQPPAGPAGRDVPRQHSEFDDQGNPIPAGDPSISERAIIGDPRDDENVIIAQLHVVFLRFHNRVADLLKQKRGAEPAFEEVQQLVRWHYQWVILDDFLKKIVNTATYKSSAPEFGPGSDPSQNPFKLRFYKPRNSAFIPLEFSFAAYRFAHSMVRPFYRLNRATDGAGQLDPTKGGPFRIFDIRRDTSGNPMMPLGPDLQSSLIGFHTFNPDWVIEWALFFKGIEDNGSATGSNRVQPSYKIDTLLVNPLSDLQHEFPNRFTELDQFPSLAQRDLIRGWRLQLPSGEAVAGAMGIGPSDPLAADLRAVAHVFPALANNTPLWYYVLAEAEEDFGGGQLGAVGGGIVMETMVGLLLADGQSFLRQNPLWAPFPEFQQNGTFGMAEFVKAATEV
jgi:hypothetical protein